MVDRYFIYGRSTCPFCTLAENFLSAQKREFYFFDYAEELDSLGEVKRFYSSETVPIILENNKKTGETIKIGGYTDLLDWHRFQTGE